MEHFGRSVRGLRYSLSDTFVMLTGYFDEAGGDELAFTFVCGWISTVENWNRFEVDWKILLSSHDIPYFHMKEFAQCRGPFAKWKNREGSRKKFLGQAAEVIHSIAQRALIGGVQHQAFAKLRNDYPVPWTSPYALAGRVCIAWANAWSRVTNGTLDVKYIFEDGGPDKGGLIASVSNYPELSIPSFEPSRDIPGKKGVLRHGLVQLQAADYLAYEIRKFFLDHPKYKSGERSPRKSLAILRKTPADIKFYDYDRLAALCEYAGLRPKGS